MRGVVKEYSNYKGGSGYITGDDGRDYYVHFTEIKMAGYKSLTANDPVEFEPKIIGSARRAHNVLRIEAPTLGPRSPVPPNPPPPILKANPFTPQNPIEDGEKFSGRTDLLVRGIQDLFNKQNVLVTGDRGIGKTSFANQLCSFAEGDRSVCRRLGIPETGREQKYLVVTHSCSPKSQEGDFLAGVISALETELGTIKEYGGREWAIDIAKILKIKWNESGRVPVLADAAARAAALIEVIQKGKKYTGVVLRVDEIDTISDDPKIAGEVANFLKVVHERVSRQRNGPLIYILSGIPGTVTDLIRGHGSVDRLVDNIILPKLRDAEVKDLVQLHLKGTKVSISPDVLQKVVEFSGGFPNPVQLLCYWMFQFDTNAKLDSEDFEQALSYIVNDVKREQYFSRVNLVPGSEYSAIMRALSAPEIDGLTSAELAARLGEKSEAVAGRLGHMKKNDLVIQTDRSEWKLKDPMFKIFCQWASL